jgi:hypothetical protein
MIFYYSIVCRYDSNYRKKFKFLMYLFFISLNHVIKKQAP